MHNYFNAWHSVTVCTKKILSGKDSFVDGQIIGPEQKSIIPAMQSLLIEVQLAFERSPKILGKKFSRIDYCTDFGLEALQ